MAKRKAGKEMTFGNFSLPKDSGYILFLDDLRIPSDVGDYIFPVELRLLYNHKDWKIVRNFEEFVYQIKYYGLPALVSFDHDLGEEEVIKGNDQSDKKEKTGQNQGKSGYDCAKWLVDYCISKKEKLPDFLVHSMNPVGSQNIKEYLLNFKKFQDNDGQ
jgi:hypothetical protein